MLKSFARAAALLVYLAITLEMLFMVTPFALYYYSFYSPLLSRPSNLRAIAWLPAFFLPHLSTEILPSLGGVVFLLGLVGFFLSALQLYYAKFRRRGVVEGGFYKRIRHPQYLFLGLAGLGLLIVWPRFILLLAYINMLWFYYLLARSEERRIEARYGELYREQLRRTSMFLPGEPGGRLVRRLFGWIQGRRARLLVLYGLSLVGAIGAAFALRGLTFSLTTHLSLPDQRIAAVSFLSVSDGELRRLVESAESTEEIQERIRKLDDWVLIQAIDGEHRVVHVMIDAGMTRRSANALPLAEKGIKLLFSRRKDRRSDGGPFSIRARWQPVFVAEMNGQKLSGLIELDPASFRGNPVMPVF
jgi:protein-S-isoprenylcysteine O-methyltransferase Ste14